MKTIQGLLNALWRTHLGVAQKMGSAQKKGAAQQNMGFHKEVKEADLAILTSPA